MHSFLLSVPYTSILLLQYIYFTLFIMKTTNAIIVSLGLQDLNQMKILIPFLTEHSIELISIEKDNPKPISTTNPLIPNYYTKLLGKKGLDVLKFLSEGNTYDEIAQKSQMSVDGVRYYVKKIYKVLNVSNSREAVKVYLTEIKQ